MLFNRDALTSGRTFDPGSMLPSPLRRLSGGAQRNPTWDDDTPVRAELFSVERLEEHARSLAASQIVTPGERKGASLSSRLSENETVLLAAYRDVAQAIETGAAITPAAEWLIDNFHIVEKQIRDIRADLPVGYYRQLPKLSAGPFAGYPRVFGVAWAYVAHTDSLFDPEVLCRYLRAFQEVQPLTIGELWAVAITLRIVLVENLRRIARRVIDSRAGRQAADIVADRLLGSGGRVAEEASVVLPSNGSTIYSDSFLVQLVHRLRDQDPSIGPALTWLDGQMARQGSSPEAVVRDEHQRQVTASVTVRNVITSMRLISDVDWTEWFERVSLVDEVFKAGSRFPEMDFPTRNLYRTAVEGLARGSGLTELEVAHAAVAAAERARPGDGHASDERLSDPGYYLIAGGLRQFEDEIGFRPSASAQLVRAASVLGIGGYVGAGFVIAGCLLAIPITTMAHFGLDPGFLLLAGALGLIPAVDLSVAILNHLAIRGVRPACFLRSTFVGAFRQVCERSLRFPCC